MREYSWWLRVVWEMIPFTMWIGRVRYGQITLVSRTHSWHGIMESTLITTHLKGMFSVKLSHVYSQLCRLLGKLPVLPTEIQTYRSSGLSVTHYWTSQSEKKSITWLTYLSSSDDLPHQWGPQCIIMWRISSSMYRAQIDELIDEG